MSATRMICRIGAGAFAAALALAPAVSTAQSRVPTREGNIWGGFDHEPNPSVVEPEERASGLASPTWEREQNDDLQRLYHDLMRSEGEPDR